MGDPDASDESERGEDAESAGSDVESAGSDAETDRYGEGFTPDDGGDAGSAGGEDDDADAPDDYGSLREELDDLRDDVDEFETEIKDRTVHREEIEDDLRSYVRTRVRRGHARGWGPYLVLLYGTAMTIGAFVELSGVWAILAMIVIWLSTLGLYVLMILVGLGITALSAPSRVMHVAQGLIDTLRDVRS